jgi:hypothetical protein
VFNNLLSRARGFIPVVFENKLRVKMTSGDDKVLGFQVTSSS